jgi:hypothetical protein
MARYPDALILNPPTGPEHNLHARAELMLSVVWGALAPEFNTCAEGLGSGLS